MQNYIKDKSLFGVLQCCYIKQSAYNIAFCFLTQSSRFSPKQYIIYSLLLYILIAKTSLKYYFLPVYLLNITTSNQHVAYYNELERNPSEMVSLAPCFFSSGIKLWGCRTVNIRPRIIEAIEMRFSFSHSFSYLIFSTNVLVIETGENQCHVQWPLQLQPLIGRPAMDEDYNKVFGAELLSPLLF